MLSYRLSFVAHHVLCSIGGSPTAYRLGLGSPTRLVRFGFVDEMASPALVNPEGASPESFDSTLTSVLGSSTAGASAFFRLRLGGADAVSAPSSAWITLPGSWLGGDASAFFRDL